MFSVFVFYSVFFSGLVTECGKLSNWKIYTRNKCSTYKQIINQRKWITTTTTEKKSFFLLFVRTFCAFELIAFSVFFLICIDFFNYIFQINKRENILNNVKSFFFVCGFYIYICFFCSSNK